MTSARWIRFGRRRSGNWLWSGVRRARRSPPPTEFAGLEPWTRTKRGNVKLTRRRQRALSREVVDDCEAFLLGRSVERFESRSMGVPMWAWTNVLAHGSPEDLSRAAEDGSGGPATGREWRAARAYLATEILMTAARGGSLVDLQQKVVAPLELQFAAGRDGRSWTPQRWVATVHSSLNAYRHSERC